MFGARVRTRGASGDREALQAANDYAAVPGLAEPEAFLLVERIETLGRVRRLRDDALHALERGVVSAAAEPPPAAAASLGDAPAALRDALDRLRRLDVYERKARSRLTRTIRTLGL